MDANEIKTKMPSEDVTTAVSDLFKVLGDATRAKILFVLETQLYACRILPSAWK